jgi:endonuclease III
MSTTTNKQRVVTQIFSGLGKKNKHPAAESRPVLEQFIYALCREGVTRERADHAFRNLKEQFFDWNEVRVSSTRELAEAMDSVPQAEARAQRIIDFLQEVFETTFSFDLEGLEKKGIKQAAKQLARYRSANDYVVSFVVQHGMGGHAIPLDDASLRTLRRLGMLDEEAGDIEAVRASIEHQVPKARAALFIDLLSDLAQDYCWEDEPNCAACPLACACPTGQEARAAVSSASHRHKPR